MRAITAVGVIGAVVCGAAAAAPARTTFALPYDLASAPRGTVLFLDRSRVLALRAGKLSVYARTPATELVAMDRLTDGTLFVADLPGGRIFRIDRARRARVVARVPEPADLVADSTGATLWVASIAPGVGVVRVDVASGGVEPFATVERPHGIDRDAAGTFYVHDGHVVSRLDVEGKVSRFADVDAFKLRVAPGGAVYGVTGTPRGGRVVRIAPDGRVTRIAGTGRLGPHRDGRALNAGILPTSVAFAPGGALLVSQLEPVPAIRRVDLATGRITTLARGR
jgi:hypothetical protein